MRALRQCLHQRDGIRDRAARQRAVLEAIDPTGELPLQRGERLTALQRAEAAERVGSEVMDEHQQRTVFCCMRELAWEFIRLQWPVA